MIDFLIKAAIIMFLYIPIMVGICAFVIAVTYFSVKEGTVEKKA